MKEINWDKIKEQLKEEFQIENWNDWGQDRRINNILEAFISMKYLVEKQLKEEKI